MGPRACDIDRSARHPDISGQDLARRAGGNLQVRKRYGWRLKGRKGQDTAHCQEETCTQGSEGSFIKMFIVVRLDNNHKQN